MDPLSEKRPVSLAGVPPPVVRYIHHIEAKTLRYQLLLEGYMRELDMEVESAAMGKLRGSPAGSPAEERPTAAEPEPEGEGNAWYVEEDGYAYEVSPPGSPRARKLSAASRHLDEISRRHWATLRCSDRRGRSPASAPSPRVEATSSCSGAGSDLDEADGRFGGPQPAFRYRLITRGQGEASGISAGQEGSSSDEAYFRFFQPAADEETQARKDAPLPVPARA